MNPPNQQGNAWLLLELGEGYCSGGLFRPDSRTIESADHAVWKDLSALEQWLMQWEGNNYERVILSSGFPQAVLLPAAMGGEDYALLQSLFSLEGAPCHTAQVPEWQLKVQYAVPEEIFAAASARFSNLEVAHAYVPMLRIYNGVSASEGIDLHFAHGQFRALVRKGGSLLLMQTYAYSGPLDVAYILLKICYEFDLKQEDVPLLLSGGVVTDSALYRELHQYFIHLQLARHPQGAEEETAGFNTALYNLAACVS